ncbi:18892_t:CDS:2, partial [Gigaspora rosea]
PLDYDIFVPIDEEYPYDFDINASDYLNDPDYMEENFFMSGNPKIDKFIRNDDICNGLRPNLDVVCVPQLLKTLIIKCWDDNPTLRPEAQEILFHFRKWYFDSDPEFRLQYQQIKVAKEELLTSNNLTYQTHPQAIYQSIA